MYDKIVLDHFQSPRNFSELKEANGFGMGANDKCGDVLKLYLKVKGTKIEDISFKTMGCVVAIASGSMLTEQCKGKTIEEAQKIKPAHLVKMLGGLPKYKLQCPELAVEALKAALNDYQKKKSKKKQPV